MLFTKSCIGCLYVIFRLICVLIMEFCNFSQSKCFGGVIPHRITSMGISKFHLVVWGFTSGRASKDHEGFFESWFKDCGGSVLEGFRSIHAIKCPFQVSLMKIDYFLPY